MKLLKKVLPTLLSFGLILTFGFSENVFANNPKNLEECCIELDKICSPEEKDKIKQTPNENWGEFISEVLPTQLGKMITLNWLYSYESDANKYKETELAKLLLEHGADHWGVAHVVMTSVVLQYYNHYLNDKIATSIEDLVIDYWFNNWHYTFKESSLTKQKLRESMETGVPLSFHKENWPTRCNIL